MNNDEFNDGGDDLLINDPSGPKNQDIIAHGEKIADKLGKSRTINPNILASQLQQLALIFDEKLIVDINNVAKC